MEDIGADIDAGSAYRLTEVPQDDRRRRGTQLIVAQEELVPYRTVRGDEVIARPRHSVHELVIRRHVRIEDAEGANDAAAHIRQERIGDVVGVTKGAQLLGGVIGDRRGVDAAGL